MLKRNSKVFSFVASCISKKRERNLHLYTRYIRYIQKRYSSERSKEADDIVVSKYESIPVANIRNFSIIAHVDHGKSTLADRLLEFTNTVKLEPGTAQVLDRLQVEKERGITVKAVTASIQYVSKITNEKYLLNLIDTPGHVDFANEVLRALGACQSVILLVDANEGVQAQTFANFYLAFGNDLIIIPVINKIDLKNANPELVEQQLHNLFDIEKSNVLRVSAKLGTGIEELLEEIIDRAPPPPVNRESPLKALLFDSWFDKHRGVVILFYIEGGEIKEGDTITSHHTAQTYIVKHVGIVRPNEYETGILKAGQVGYVTCNMRSVKEAQIGDTFYFKDAPVKPFPGFKPTQPMVFAGIYPVDQTQNLSLRSAIEKLTLTDSAVTMEPEVSPALGRGWRLGFLGLLHLEVFNQRLDQEYDAQTVTTAPSVTYKIRIRGEKNIKFYGGEEIFISNPTKLPDPSIITGMLEPTVKGTIITPVEYMKEVTALCIDRRGEEHTSSEVDDTRIMIQYIFPLNEIIVDFHDELKRTTSGFASFDYEDHEYVLSDLTKVDIMLNGKIVEELSMIIHKSKARTLARDVCLKLSNIIPRQQFLIAIQACIGGKIIARENVKPFRKDVTQKLYGGDVTRRNKLLQRQAEGKRKMRMIGKVEIPRDAFIQLFKR